METVVTSLSNLISREWESTISNVEYLQTKRTYTGGYSFTFPFALSGFNDYKSKEYSNFYLTTAKTTDSFISINDTTESASIFLTYFKFGEHFLQKNTTFAIDDSALPISLTTSLSADCYFTLNLYPDNVCTVSYDTEYGVSYYLATTDDRTLVYLPNTVISTSLTGNPSHKFSYIYDSEDGEFYLIRQLSALSAGVVYKYNDALEIANITRLNKIKLFGSVIELSRPNQYKLNSDLNTSFIRYDGTTTTVDASNSESSLPTNFLIHSPITSNKKNLIALKTQVAVGDVFTNGQNLLSGESIQAVDGMRNYVSISNPIDSENSTEISLNYVFYNQPYTISKGITQFQAPSSMYPFVKLNVNDTKFVMAGAFPYKTPDYADKVYKLDDVAPTSDGRVYLCTWLSGTAADQRWVDRYYYPDYTTKEAALSTKGVFDITYDDSIEQLVAANVNLNTSVQKYKIFDKISDLTFEANAKYEYQRFAKELSVTNLATCADLPYNYQNTINNTHKLTLAFYFSDDGSDWLVQSLRNSINAGVKVLKFDDSLYLELNLFKSIELTTTSFNTVVKYNQNDLNFVCFTFDALMGRGGFYVNGVKALDIKTGFGEFQNDPLLYGKFYFNDVDIFSENSKVENILMNSEYIDEDLIAILPILQGYSPVDDIYITLPCGMRNAIDDVSYINNICKTNTNRSNFINISIDNVGITNPQILNDLSNTIKETVGRHVPASTVINNLNFVNYL